MQTRWLAFALLLFGLLSGGCQSPQVEEAVIGPKEAAPPHPETKPSPLNNTMSGIRNKAASTRPDQKHEIWNLYRIEGYIYGQSRDEPGHDFLTEEVEKSPGKIVLLGQAIVHFPSGERWTTAEFSPDSRTTLTKDGRIHSKSRSKIIAPLE